LFVPFVKLAITPPARSAAIIVSNTILTIEVSILSLNIRTSVANNKDEPIIANNANTVVSLPKII
jgi:hypothetical protein